MSRKSVRFTNGREAAFGFDKFPYGYFLQVFDQQDEMVAERDGMTNVQWLKACEDLLDDTEFLELREQAQEAITQIILDLDINGRPFSGELNIKSL